MLTYFLQVNLCWLIFYGLYWALLSRETFFKLNRIYLIISLLCGLVVPIATEYMSQMEEVVAMPIVQISQPMAQSIEAFQENIEINMVKTAETWNLWQILRGCYVVGVLWVLIRFLIGLLKIQKLYQRGFKEKNNDFTLVQCEGLKTPFSFFKWIFIDKTLYDAAVLAQILEHEKAHVHQKHSFDIVGIEILRGIFWMSPLVHIYARSLRNVHEYLADAAVLQNTEKKQYGRLLISQSAYTSGLIIANHFNFSQLKKRIIMMSRNRSERKALVKYTLAAPLFLLSILAFTVPNSPLVKNTEGVAERLDNAVNAVNSKVKNKLQNIDNQSTINDCPNGNTVNLECEKGGFWKPERFKKQSYLNVEKGYTLKSFKLVKFNESGEVLATAYNKGPYFNKEVLNLIEKAKVGDKYSFLEIKIEEPYYDVDEYVWGSIDIHISEKEFPKHQILQYGLFTKNDEFVIRNGLYFKTFKDLKKVFVLEDYEISRPIGFTKWTNEHVMGSNKGMINYQAKTNSPSFDKEALSILENTHAGESYSFSWEMKRKGKDSTIIAAFFLKAVDTTINKYPFLMLPNYKGGMDISLEELKQKEYLIAKTTEKGESKTLKILKFNVLLTPSFHSKKEVKVVVNIGANFSEDVKKLLASAEEGDEISFINNEVFDKEKNSLVATRGLMFRVKTK